MKLYFHHIGKTAGMSFRRYLLDQLGDENVSPLLRRVKFSDAIRDYDRFVAIGGHISPVPGDKLVRDRVAVTFLRDPIERVLSEYSFSRTLHFAGRARLSCGGDDLDSWVNVQSEEGRVVLNAHLQAFWPFGWDVPGIPTLEQMVEAAKVGLDQFDIVGLQDHFSESVAHFAQRIGWEAPAVVKYENVTQVRSSSDALSDAMLGKLQRLLEPDYEIYRHALIRFGRQRQSFDQSRTAANGLSASGSPRQVPPGPPTGSTTRRDDPIKAIRAPVADANADDGERQIGIVSVALHGLISGGSTLLTGEMVNLDVRFRARVSELLLTVGFLIEDHFGTPVFGTNTRRLGQNIAVDPGVYSALFQFRNDLGLGVYQIVVALHRGASESDGCFERRNASLKFEVVDTLTEPFDGRSRLYAEAAVSALSPEANVVVSPSRGNEPGEVWKLGQRNPVLSTFSGRVVQDSRIRSIRCGSDHLVQVSIHNTGSEVWRAFGKQSVRVSYHWSDAEGNYVEYEGLRTLLPRDIAGGDSLTFPCFLRAPDVPGPFSLTWTLVQESVAWFNDRDVNSQFTSEFVVTA